MSRITVLTNGLLVSEKNVGALAGHVTRIAVAFDGTSSHDPAFLRGSQRFDQLVSAVQIMAALLGTLAALSYLALSRTPNPRAPISAPASSSR